MRLLLLIWLGAMGFSPSEAADKIPVSIAALSMPQLASDGYYHRWGEALAKASGELFDVKMLVRGELGADETIFNALRRDRVQLVGVGYASISTVIPEFTLLNAPFLFDSWEDVDFVYDNFLIPLLNEMMREHDIIGISHYGMVWHGIYGRRPILEPADVKNVRFRALIDPASQFTAQQLGGDMIQIPSTDVVTALQTGLIDGGETNDLIYVMTGTERDAPHYTLSRHTVSMLGVIATKKFWDRLTPEQQNLVMASYPPTAEARAGIRADGLREIALGVTNKGVKTYELTPESRARWKVATLPVHEQLITQAGGRARELYNRVLEGKRAFTKLTNKDGPTP